MSSSDDAIPRREVAWRIFASEFDDADFSYAESDEERAPNYVVTPSGARINRVFVVGVLTEVEDVNDDVVRARIVDPTGAFVVYAGQYQPEALAALEAAETPSFVALTGKARTFEPDDSDVVYTSIRPESVNEVDADTRDRWVVRTAEQTLDRVGTMAAALDRPERGENLAALLEDGGVPTALASGTALAIDHYGTTSHYLAGLRDLSLDAARVVAGDLNEVSSFDRTPDAEGDGTVDPASLDVGAATVGETLEAEHAESADEAAGTSAQELTAPTDESATEDVTPDADEAAPEDAQSDVEAASEPDAEPEPEPESVSDADPDSDADSDSDAVSADDGDGEAEDAGTDEMQGLTDEERAEVEENFDVGFDTGSDIPDQGEADIETPDPDPAPAETVEAEGTDDEIEEPVESDADDEDLGDFDDEFDDPDDVDDLDDFTEAEYDEPESDAEDAESAPPDIDLEDAVIDEMQALDDGDGAPRDSLIRTLKETYEVSEGQIDDAIQSALMGGRCYESGEDHLKAI